MSKRYFFIFLMCNSDDRHPVNYIINSDGSDPQEALMQMAKEEWETLYEDDYPTFDEYMREEGNSWLRSDLKSWNRIDRQTGTVETGEIPKL